MMGSNKLHGTTDSSATKNTKNIDTETNNSYGLQRIPSSKYPKVAKMSDRLLLPVKHSVPTLTDEDKNDHLCRKNTNRYVLHGRKKSVGEHPLIESRGAVFRRSEDRLRFKSIIPTWQITQVCHLPQQIVVWPPSSWRETFSKLNSTPRLGGAGNLFKVKFDP